MSFIAVFGGGGVTKDLELLCVVMYMELAEGYFWQIGIGGWWF